MLSYALCTDIEYGNVVLLVTLEGGGEGEGALFVAISKITAQLCISVDCRLSLVDRSGD